MKVRGHFTTRTEVEVTPGEALQSLRDALLDAVGLPANAYLSEDKTKILVTQTWNTSHSWDEEVVVRFATELDQKLLTALRTMSSLIYDLRDKIK